MSDETVTTGVEEIVPLVESTDPEEIELETGDMLFSFLIIVAFSALGGLIFRAFQGFKSGDKWLLKPACT